MKKDHYQSAAIITAALISERPKNAPAVSKEQAASLYAELVVALDEAVKKIRRADDQPD